MNDFASVVLRLFDEVLGVKVREGMTDHERGEISRWWIVDQPKVIADLTALNNSYHPNTMPVNECRDRLSILIDDYRRRYQGIMAAAGGQRYTFGQPAYPGYGQPTNLYPQQPYGQPINVYGQPVNMYGGGGYAQPFNTYPQQPYGGGYGQPYGAPGYPYGSVYGGGYAQPMGAAQGFLPQQQKSTVSAYGSVQSAEKAIKQTIPKPDQAPAMPPPPKPVETPVTVAPKLPEYRIPELSDTRTLKGDADTTVSQQIFKEGTRYLTYIDIITKKPIVTPYDLIEKIKKEYPMTNLVSVRYKTRDIVPIPFEDYRKALASIKEKLAAEDSPLWEDQVKAVIECLTPVSHGIATAITSIVRRKVNNVLDIFPELEKYQIKTLQDLLDPVAFKDNPMIKKTVVNAIQSLTTLVVEDPADPNVFDSVLANVVCMNGTTWADLKANDQKKFDEMIKGFSVVTSSEKCYIWTDLFLENATYIDNDFIRSVIPLRIEFADTPVDSDFEFLMKLALPTNTSAEISISGKGMTYTYEAHPVNDATYVFTATEAAN